MNKREAALILSTMRVGCPRFYQKQTDDDIRAAVSYWAMMFKDESYELVSMAVNALLKTRPADRWSPPEVNEVNEMIQRLTQPEEMTEMEAWACVTKAVRNSAYDSRREFEKLPPIVQRIVGSPSQLYEWSQMESGIFNSVVSSNFQRSFKARSKNEREYLALPSDAKRFMESLASGMSMKQLTEGGE